jgi:hypothetical protein
MLFSKITQAKVYGHFSRWQPTPFWEIIVLRLPAKVKNATPEVTEPRQHDNVVSTLILGSLG